MNQPCGFFNPCLACYIRLIILSMKTRVLPFTLTICLSFVVLSLAPVRAEEPLDDKVFEKVMKDFLKAKFKGEAEAFYMDEVILIPGHEYLKRQYGLSEDGDRSKALTVSSEKLVKLDKENSKEIPEEKLEGLFAKMAVTNTKIGEDGDYPLRGEDGGRGAKVACKAGDVVVIAGFEGTNDILALLLRKSGDAWKVAGEMID